MILEYPFRTLDLAISYRFFDSDIENQKTINYIENKPMITHLIPVITYTLSNQRTNLLVLSTLKLAAQFILTSKGKL